MSTLAPTRTVHRWWMLPAAALLLVVALGAAGLHPRAVLLAYLALVTPLLVGIDIADRRLPNRLVLPAYPIAAVTLAAQAIVDGAVPVTALASGAAYFAFMLVFAVGGGMGMGDVKLAGVLGLAAGSLGMLPALVSPVAAFLLGGVAALAALRTARGAGIPFGPSLLAGFWIAVVAA